MKKTGGSDDLMEVVKRLARVVERQQEEIERLNSRPLVYPQPYPVYPYYPWPWYQRPYISWTVPMYDTVTTTTHQDGTSWTAAYANNPGSTTFAIGEGNA